jgi:murein DD-endopeptidase MepM/ murein hydrolase activator NlpD
VFGTRIPRRAALGVLLTAIAVAVPGTALADPGGDKARVDAQLAQTQATLEAATTRAQQAALDYERATAALPGAQAALAAAQGRLADAQAAQRSADRRAVAAAAEARTAGESYAAAEGQVDQARARVGTFVAGTYKGSGFLALSSILDSGSPSDLAQRIGYLDQVAASQRRALNEVTAAQQVARQRQADADRARQAAEQAQQAARKAVADALNAQMSAKRAADDVTQLIDQKAKALAVAKSERDTVLAQYKELKAESDRIAAELRAPGAGGSSAPATPMRPGAFFLMPTHGWKSSDFGMRYDPYYQVWQLHAGVDIAAPTGQAIAAAADGTVTHAGWTGGYGNYTCISHGTYQGRNLATCYAHQSQILVAVGESVRRGAVIGRVGTTGASTGSHLHFEVRLGGEPVQPLNWLPSCLC